ncbi:hypothetical protein Dimus_022615 [Dionaea muscipula]
MVKALPIDVIWKKRVIRSKIVREGWMNNNGLRNVMELIKRQRWENLFKKRLLVHVDAVKEFYAKMTVIHLKKKDVVKSSVKGISIEFDHEQCVAILDVHWKKLEYVNTSRRCGKSRGGRSEERKKKNNDGFDWEAVIDEAAIFEGESGSGEKFYDAEEEAQGSPDLHNKIQTKLTKFGSVKDEGIAGVDPSGHTCEES